MCIVVLVQANIGVNYYSINTQLVYLCTEVGFTVLYTILVTGRLLVMRRQMKQAVTTYDSSTYDTVVRMVVESAMPYTVFACIFIVAFALHSNNISTICFLSINQVRVSMPRLELSASLMLAFFKYNQGIAQLFIIIRVARGRAVTREWSTRAATAPTTIRFGGTVPGTSDETGVEEIARAEQNSVHVCSVSSKTAEVV